LDGKHVIFGQVVKGKSVVREVENLKTTAGDAPVSPVVIEDCGELSADDPSLSVETAGATEGVDPYEDWPEDEDSGNTEDPQVALKIASDVRVAANALFKAGNINGALAKYQSTRYTCLTMYCTDESLP
jgi:peptidyl-prolyl isomerase D